MKVTSIKDINDQYDYNDENPKGKSDSSKVSCGQDGSYNELKYIYDTYLKPKVDDETITKQSALDALDLACRNLDNPRSRDSFYRYLEKKLKIVINA